MGQLGDTLRERRTSLGISLDTAEADTKIRARLLEALEAGEYAKLPNPGYVRGYVSSYARYLELDSVPLLAMYRAETGAGRFHDINIAEEQPVSHRHEQHAVPWRVGVIAFVVVALIAVVGWIAYRAYRGPSTPPPIPATTHNSSEDSASPGAHQTQTAAPPFTLKVHVASTGASAVKITVDGGVAFNSTLTGGQNKTFEVTKTAVVRIAKPSQVTVTRDGKKIDMPASIPAVITLTAGQQP
jgi:cytoskeleton protein RodZ